MSGCLLAVLLSCSADAQAAAADFSLPYPALEYCWRTRDPLCRKPLTPLALAQINMTVNEAIASRADAPGRDVWTAFPADRVGDCDDLAATKRAALQGLGFAGAMRFARGRVPRDGAWVDHMVLEVDLPEPDGRVRTWILDSLPGPGGATLYEARDPDRVWRPIDTENPVTVPWTIHPPPVG